MKQNIYRPFILIGFIVSMIIAIHCRNKIYQREKPIIGVKIYQYDGSLPNLFAEWKKLGINTAFTSVELCAKDHFRTLAAENGIKVFIILPIFFNPEALQKNPDLYAITGEGKPAIEGWVEFVCPSRDSYRSEKVQEIKHLVQTLNPDGISLDFIRHFVFWEQVFPEAILDSLPNTCFDTSCMMRFQKDTRIHIPDDYRTPEQMAAWITENHSPVWTKWKCHLITSMIQNIVLEAKTIKPDLMVNVHAVPWRQNDFGNAIKIVAGQDFAQISRYVNFLSPMTYAHMVKQSPLWIHEVVNDMANQTDCKIIPSLQVEKAYLETELTLDEFKISLHEALKPPSSGVVFWSWNALEHAPEKRTVIQSIQ